MGSGIDSPREAGDDGESRMGELIGNFPGGVDAVGCRAAGADNADRVFVAGKNFSPDIEQDG